MTDRRIVLVGFMGCGKTSVAKELARELGCESIDLDAFIREASGRSPAEIILREGERAFRWTEERVLKHLLKQTNARVIALGGGTWTILDNRAAIWADECLTVWLDAPFDLCWKRIQGVNVPRPLAPNREATKNLYELRREDYRRAEIHIQVVSADGPSDVVKKILAEM